MNRPTLRVLSLLMLAAVTVIAGCSTGTLRKVAPAEAVALIGARTVIDVRTPGEFAAGHVAGAINIDVEAADFASRIATLDKKAGYLVYCRSGRRSEVAAKAMTDAGFSDVVDAGALDDLLAAGAPAGR